jgi:hypothetical protein
MKKLSDAYNKFKIKVEGFVFRRVIPPLFKLILIGIQIALVWVFYEMVVNVVNELL